MCRLISYETKHTFCKTSCIRQCSLLVHLTCHQSSAVAVADELSAYALYISSETPNVHALCFCSLPLYSACLPLLWFNCSHSIEINMLPFLLHLQQSACDAGLSTGGHEMLTICPSCWAPDVLERCSTPHHWDILASLSDKRQKCTPQISLGLPRYSRRTYQLLLALELQPTQCRELPLSLY